jgi:hypothetical protein
MFNDTTTAGASEAAVDQAPTKPKTRPERIADWRKENRAAYEAARNAHVCCTPSRQQMILFDQWENPPVD